MEIGDENMNVNDGNHGSFSAAILSIISVLYVFCESSDSRAPGVFFFELLLEVWLQKSR